jgi:hypothetical protein
VGGVAQRVALVQLQPRLPQDAKPTDRSPGSDNDRRPRNPVVVKGLAEHVADPDLLRTVLDAENAKYGTDYGIELLDPAVSACFRFRLFWAFALTENDFTGSPTRWRFEL